MFGVGTFNTHDVETMNVSDPTHLIESILERENYCITTVVQIGGNDGVQSDFIRKFIVENEWEAHILEPIDCYFEELKWNYSEIPNVFCYPYAIMNEDGERQIHFAPPSEKISWAKGCSTFYPEKNRLGGGFPMSEEAKKHFDENVSLKRVETLTWKSFTQKSQITKVDMMVIDTEGCEWEILQQIPLDQLGVKILVLEYHNHTDEDKKRILNRIHKEGMTVMVKGWDLIAYRK